MVSLFLLTSVLLMLTLSARGFVSRLSRNPNFQLRMSVSALVPIADGTEEIEAVTVIDTLVRGGVSVTVAAVTRDVKKLDIVASRGVKLLADKHIDEVECDFDLIAVPGGMPGAENLRDCSKLTAMLKEHKEKSKLVAAICAAPAVVLKHHGLLEDGVPATCYPAAAFTDTLKSDLQETGVVVSGNVVTSRGPGTALSFSLKLVELLVSKEKADEVGAAMLHQYNK